MPGRKINPHRGWEIYEQGLEWHYQNIKENPWQYRVDSDRKMEMGVEGEEKFARMGYPRWLTDWFFLSKIIRELHRAIQDGATKGYLIWTLRWLLVNGYKNRYGLVELQLGTPTKTYPQKNPPLVPEGEQQNGFKE